jgi:hypothetical protein
MGYTPQLPPILQSPDLPASRVQADALDPLKAPRFPSRPLESAGELDEGAPRSTTTGPPIPGIPVRPVRSVRHDSEMPLSQFEVEGHPIEIVVPGLTETLWFVPTEDHALVLGSRGIRRGRIWTAAELRAVAAMPEASRDELLTMANVKARFDGVVVEVRETP